MATNGNGGSGLPTWRKLAAFQVFGDYQPMQDFRVLVQVGTDPTLLHTLIERRSTSQQLLDPDLARAVLRAGLGLLRTRTASFVYATVEETIVMLRPDVTAGEGAPIAALNRLVSDYSATLSLLLGRAVCADARIYEVPDVGIARRAVIALAEDNEEMTPRRSALWLGSQLRGRGQPFHMSMIETLEEQSHLLQTNGIDMDALPSWWWRGVAAADRDGGVRIYDELPSVEELGALVQE